MVQGGWVGDAGGQREIGPCEFQRAAEIEWRIRFSAVLRKTEYCSSLNYFSCGHEQHLCGTTHHWLSVQLSVHQ